ncbi:MAG: WecB/TagA/CpsF family glycosyltransferase, partial [Paracoccaceae bacterium]|nr:WecB/TagA/CpsF family glycosyltransferase [Paracoccaceae bacterium]
MEFRFDTTLIAVNLPDKAALVDAVKTRLTAGQGFALATINLDHLAKLSESAAFRQAYAAQDMVVADGNPVVWLSWLARRPVSLVPGADMVLPLARVAAQEGVTVGLVGSTEAALAAAAQTLCAEIPGLQINARIAPAFGFDPEGPAARAIFAELTRAKVGLCFVALGAPKQEVFAALG